MAFFYPFPLNLVTGCESSTLFVVWLHKVIKMFLCVSVGRPSTSFCVDLNRNEHQLVGSLEPAGSCTETGNLHLPVV